MDNIPESIQVAVQDFVGRLSQKIRIEKVVLFGSYAKGNFRQHSDVDIAIFSDYFKHMSRIDGIQYLLIAAMDYNIDIEPQPFTLDDFENPDDLVEEILKTGIEIKLPKAS